MRRRRTGGVWGDESPKASPGSATEHEARALVDRAAAHVGRDASAAELFRVATVAVGWRAST